MDSHELKSLQVRINQLQSEINADNEDIQARQNVVREKCKAIKKLREQLDRANTELTVSEHAMLRYFERKYGFNLEDIKSEILSEKTKDFIKTLGSGKYPIEAGGRIVVKGNVVVSYVV